MLVAAVQHGVDNYSLGGDGIIQLDPFDPPHLPPQVWHNPPPNTCSTLATLSAWTMPTSKRRAS